jgi:hypothetical protein
MPANYTKTASAASGLVQNRRTGEREGDSLVTVTGLSPKAEVEARFGSWEDAAATPAGRKLRRAAFRRAEEAFHRGCAAPLHRAAILLALTPAPDPRALIDKIAVVQAHKLHEEGIMPRCALDVLADDVERLAPSGLRRGRWDTRVTVT